MEKVRGIHRINKSIGLSFPLSLIIAVLIGCRFDIPSRYSIDATDPAQKLTRSGVEFALEWDDDSGNTAYYRVFSRIRGAREWELLATGLSSPTLVITREALAYGEYEFAVGKVDRGGSESPLHTSLDADAIPETGWYLEWKP